ncbi:hypothetical protein BH18ACI4_BH18ACI4_07940 [soil metagenome]
MTNRTKSDPLRRWRGPLACAAVLAFGSALYFSGLRHNPPGFFLDESSIAFNAHTISQSGRDEYGVAWPLYFRAFGEFKNPVYIYLLALLFRLTGPSILVARCLSATAGLATVTVLGVLAARVTGRRAVGLFVAVSAMLTPWLFELSRVVFEVALYPLALALFFLCLHSAAQKAEWSWRDTIPLATTLGLLTYTYSIGRLLAPLLALGLLLFIQRVGWSSVLPAWGLYVLTLVPVVVFNSRHPGALTGRFSLITYLTPGNSPGEIALGFLKHYAANVNPWRLLITGDPNYYQMAHVQGAELMLAATFLLAAAGAWVVLRGGRPEAWWAFVLYGLAASAVPASLTKESFHMLHLAPVPVFLIILTAPSLDWLLAGKRYRRAALIVLAAATLAQGAVFQWQYHASASSPRRRHLFDAEYSQKILEPALARKQTPIYLADALGIPGYINAYWYATLRGFDLSLFTKLPAEVSPPTGALVISTRESWPGCEILSRIEPYALCVTRAPPRLPEPLSNNSSGPQIEKPDPPAILGQPEKISLVKTFAVIQPGNVSAPHRKLPGCSPRFAATRISPPASVRQLQVSRVRVPDLLVRK